MFEFFCFILGCSFSVLCLSSLIGLGKLKELVTTSIESLKK